MSYNKLGFTNGQVLKAEHLNHMEEGIANAGGIPTFKREQLTEDKLIELAKTRTVFFLIEDANTGGALTSIMSNYRAELETFVDDCGDCGDFGAVPARVIVSSSNYTLLECTITDEQVREIWAAWGIE